MIKLKFSRLVASLILIFTPIGVEAQTVRKSLPMEILVAEGMFHLTVPDTQTTKSAFGGKLRVYDVHIAKMFEVTYLECEKFGDGGTREWYYYAGSGNINMGTFNIPCKLVYDIVAAYGLGPSKNTPIIYGQEESGPPITRMVSVPTLNLTGGKEQKWINFTKNFKPISR